MKPFQKTLLFFLGALGVVTVHAKTATIEWKSFKLAVKYHLQIQRGESTVIDTTLDKQSTRWNGNLDPGLYQYRIRVYDRVGRPGKWSQYFPMVVKPDAPRPSLAEDEEVYPDADGSIVLSWEPVPNVDEYRVVILKNRKRIYQRTVKEPKAVVRKIPPGNYAWQVQGLLKDKNGKRGPASTSSIAAGELSRPRRFEVNSYLYVPPARVGLFSATGPYSYSIQTPSTGTVSALGMTNGLAADLWLGDHVFIDLNVESAFLRVEGTLFHLGDRRLHVNYTPLRASGSSRWEFSVGAGARLKEYLRVLSSSGTYTGIDRHNLLGVDAQLRLRRFFSRSFVGGVEVAHLFGFSLLGETDGTRALNAAKPLGNISAKLTGQLLLSDSWDVELAIMGEKSSLTVTGGSLSANQDISQLQLRGYASLNFRF